jgi:hypothetical protein
MQYFIILNNMIIFVVLSRDRSDFIYCTADKSKADKAKKEQETYEEMMGGRPSVYIKITSLK